MGSKKKKFLENLYNYDSKSNSYEINLSLRNYEEIYNSYDYSQYKKRDMDEDFLDYVYQESLGIPLKYNIRLMFHMKKEVYEESKSKSLKNAFKNNFMWRLSITVQQLKDLYNKCLLLLLAGILFLMSTFIFSEIITINNTFFDVFSESLSIIGWVFLWDLVEILVFDVTKLQKKKKVLKRLMDSNVGFEAY